MLQWSQKHQNQPWTQLGSASSGESLFRRKRRSTCHRQGKKGQYLGPWAINWKNKDTLLSQTLKVEEKKVSLVFLFVAQEPRYGHFIFWSLGSKVRDIVKLQKYQYLGSWATNQKTKDTFFSSTFKVWESKVSLVFFIYGPGAKILAFPSLDDTTYFTS